MKSPDYILRLMNEKAIKVMDLSRKSGIKYSTLADILSKGFERTGIQNILAICKALEIDPCELLEIDKSTLTYDESALLANYRVLPAQGQNLLLKISNVMSDELTEKAKPAASSRKPAPCASARRAGIIANAHPGRPIPTKDDIDDDYADAAYYSDMSDAELNERYEPDDQI